MSTSIVNDALLIVDDFDISGQSNTVGLDYEAESHDETVFGDDTRKNKGGLDTVGISAEGFFDPDMDSDLFSDIGVQDKLLTVAIGKAVGDVAYNCRVLVGSYTPLDAAVGELASYTLEASASNTMQRGQILFKNDAVTATGSGSTLNAGAAATSITAILHVYSASGTTPTLDVDIESDSSDDFTGLETTQISFTQATGRTAERKTAGSTSDTWWRISYTIGGSSPSFGFAVVLILQ